MWPQGEFGVSYRRIAEPGLTGYAVGGDGTIWSKRPLAVRFPKGWRRVSIHRRPYGSRYCVVSLRLNGKGKVVCRYVHRLVLEAFVGPCPLGHECAHDDSDTSNNRVSNLAWKTHSGNMTDKLGNGTYGRKLTAEAVTEIRTGSASDVEYASQFGASVTQVQKARLGGSWKCHPAAPRRKRKAAALWNSVINPEAEART